MTVHKLTPEWEALLENPAFWESYLPAAPVVGTFAEFEAADEKRLRLFGIDLEQRKAMDCALFGEDLIHQMSPLRATPEMVAEVDALLTGFADGLQKDELRRQLLQKRLLDLHNPAPRQLMLSFPGEWTWTITFERPGVYHDLVPPNCDAPLPLGSIDPHSRMPILRREEAEYLATMLTRSCDTWARFAALLLAPTVWLTCDDDEAQYRAFLQRALRSTGLFDETALATVIEDWMPEEPPRVSWRSSEEHGFVNDGVYSYRNPENAGWSAEDFHTFERFLSHQDEHSF